MTTTEINKQLNEVGEDNEEAAILVATKEIKNQIYQHLNKLSVERLSVIADFVTYLVEKESQEATDELLAIPGFAESFEKAKKNIADGKVKSWKEIRRVSYI